MNLTWLPEQRTRPLGTYEVAEKLGVHINTVRRIDPADLPYFTISDRNDRRYLPEDVETYIARRMVRSR